MKFRKTKKYISPESVGYKLSDEETNSYRIEVNEFEVN